MQQPAQPSTQSPVQHGTQITIHFQGLEDIATLHARRSGAVAPAMGPTLVRVIMKRVMEVHQVAQALGWTHLTDKEGLVQHMLHPLRIMAEGNSLFRLTQRFLWGCVDHWLMPCLQWQKATAS